MNPFRRKSLRAHLTSAASAWHVWVPIALLIAFCLPRLVSMLPAPIDFSDEIYQPQQTLKFVASKGAAFDKYGPTLNYLLLPVYGVSFVYWKLTGQFGRPSSDWPFGFTNPLPQLGVLIFETRLLVLILSSIMIGVVSRTIRRVTRSQTVALLATLLVLVSNYNVLWHAPLARPDSTMLIFLLLALTIILKIALKGPTRSRAIWLGLCCAASAGAKENAGPILTLSLLGLLVYLVWRMGATDRTRPVPGVSQNIRTDGGPSVSPISFRDVWICAAWTFASGAIAYALTNIAPSPSNWLARMSYWLVGDGLSGDVWARSPNWIVHSRFVVEAMWNNLGPVGVIVTPLLVLIALIRRPWIALLMLVPFVGCLITVYAIPYTPDRFVLPGAASLVFPAALGLAELLRTRLRTVATVIAAVTIVINLWWCTITWHINGTTEQAMVEHAVKAEDKRLVKAYAVMFDDPPSMRRLQWLGHAVDMRAMQRWLGDSKPKPDIVFANSGRIQMIEEARRMPGRADYYRHLAKFDVEKWPGMSGLGYSSPVRYRVPLPGYLRPLEWMPLVKELRHRDVLVYRKLS